MVCLGKFFTTMTITAKTFYGGYRQIYIDGDQVVLTALSNRFIRIVSAAWGGKLYLPPANVLPIIRGGAIFTVWNEGYYNIKVMDAEDNEVGCIQGTSQSTHGTPACWTNIHLIDSSSAAGSWLIQCGECVDEPSTGTTDTDFTTTGGGGSSVDPPTTTEEGDCTDQWGHNLPALDCLW